MMKHAEQIVIVGAGPVGLWSAIELQRRGKQVMVLERGEIAAGPSGGNCGYLSPSHVMPLCGPGVVLHTLPQILKPGGALSVPPRFDPKLWRWMVRFAASCNAKTQTRSAIGRHTLLAESMRITKQWVDENHSDCLWQAAGLLMVHKHRKTLDAYESVVARLRSEFGLRLDRYDDGDLTQFEPALRDGLAGGWHFPDDAHVDPRRLMRGLVAAIENQGGVVRTGATVEFMAGQRAGAVALGVRVGGEQELIQADHVVMAAGAESATWKETLGVSLPIVPGKGYSMSVAMPDTPVRVPVIFEDTHVAITPLADRLRIGSTMQLTGYDSRVDPKRLRWIRDDAQSYLRDEIDTDYQDAWTGWRPMSFDGLPIIDRAPKQRRIIIASGNGMIGLSTGAATGRIVAETLLESEPTIDPAPYRMERFGRKSAA
ncbi:MAG: FAD-dependent oxidoreductase [Planctomycetota bacterium]